MKKKRKHAKIKVIVALIAGLTFWVVLFMYLYQRGQNMVQEFEAAQKAYPYDKPKGVQSNEEIGGYNVAIENAAVLEVEKITELDPVPQKKAKPSGLKKQNK